MQSKLTGVCLLICRPGSFYPFGLARFNEQMNAFVFYKIHNEMGIKGEVGSVNIDTCFILLKVQSTTTSPL